MQESSDAQLLRQYADEGDEAAFRVIVERYTDLVYSSALRQVGATDAAADIAQSIFIDLARKSAPLARQISNNDSLVGWLYRSTRFTSLNHLRTHHRRAERERLVMEQLTPESSPSPDWNAIRPALDDAMSELSDDDRDALLLRYFKNHDFRSVGNALGISDDAAQKRVSRAVERLRSLLTQRGVTVSASALALVISTSAVQAAPTGLTLGIYTAATSFATTATVVTKTITMTTLQKATIGFVIATAVGVGVLQTKQNLDLRSRLKSTQEQQAPVNALVEQLNESLLQATNQLAGLQQENAQLRSNVAALPSLRNQVTQLRSESQELAKSKSGNTNDSMTAAAVSWQERAVKLKQHMENNPSSAIPELQYATEEDWLNAAKENLETETDYRKAMSQLRGAMERKFATNLKAALGKYMKANNNQFPTDMSQLLPHFDPAVDPAVLDRYAILPKGELPGLGMGGDRIISQKSPVDAELDSRTGIGPNGWGSSGPHSWKENSRAINALEPAIKEYVAAHGRPPADPSQLVPYLKTPEQKKAYDDALKLMNSQNTATSVK